MNTERDIDIFIRNGLALGPSLRSGAVAEVVRRASTTPQQRRLLAQSPRWRFQTMYSATKYLVAGVGVALIGGFLLSGGMLTQPSDGRLPVMGASVPATTQAELTADEEVDTPTTSLDILPGVDLVTEEVGPGIYRVLSDGFRNLEMRVHGMAVSPEGDVWLELGTPKNWSVIKLGDSGVSQPLSRKAAPLLGLIADGMPVVGRQGGFRVLDGDTWVKVDETAFSHCRQGTNHPHLIGADGSCWTAGEGDVVVVRLDADGRRTEFSRTEVGLAPGQRLGGPLGLDGVVAPDGTLWFAVSHGGRRSQIDALAAYDGSSWSAVPVGDDDLVSYELGGVGADGVVWVPNLSADVTKGGYDIWSWDGSSWSSHRFEPEALDRLWPVRVWSNGIIWFGPVATRWDGSAFRVVEAVVPGAAYARPTVAPGGIAWTLIDQQLYVITPEDLAAGE